MARLTLPTLSLEDATKAPTLGQTQPSPSSSQAEANQRFLPTLRPSVAGRLLTSNLAIRAVCSALESRRNHQIVSEFLNKLRMAEDLISKLTFSLREIQDSRRGKAKPTRNSARTLRFPQF